VQALASPWPLEQIVVHAFTFHETKD